MIPNPLPPDFYFTATGPTGKTWPLKSAAGPPALITLHTPDGDIEFGFTPEGQPHIRSYNMQGDVRAGGPDNTLVVSFFSRESPPAPVAPDVVITPPANPHPSTYTPINPDL